MELGRNGSAGKEVRDSLCLLLWHQVWKGKNQVDTQVNSLPVPFLWDSFSSLQAEQNYCE